MKTLRAIAHLMAYPTEPMQQALPELAEVIRQELTTPQGFKNPKLGLIQVLNQL